MTGFTHQQQQAIEARGNVLVVAGAGTGKTRTLVERCLAHVLAAEHPLSLDHLLMVTFTEAAAAEMRQRICARLAEESRKQPGNQWLAEQLALADTARICTLHSFCLQLVREHFHELSLDPQLAVLEEAQTEILAAETLQTILAGHYAGQSPRDVAVRDLILTYGGGRDESIRGLVRRLHNYAQTQPEPEQWLEGQRARASEAEPTDWRRWLLEGLDVWRQEWLDNLQPLAAANPNAAQCLTALAELRIADCGLRNGPLSPTSAAAATSDPMPQRVDEPPGAETVEVLKRILAADGNWPKGKKGALRAPLDKLFKEASFLLSLVEWEASPTTVGGGESPELPTGAHDPLGQDWGWVRPHLETLLALVAEFSAQFTAAKRELGAVDFHDLEQFALRLLWNVLADRPSALAEHWRETLRLVFVDEYQDINAAQDRIIRAISRDGPLGNRFLVGDVKQSIYRFRLADPRIFTACAAAWRAEPGAGTVVSLSDNFRSHAAILDFVNQVFAALLRPEVGGVTYDQEAWLRFGDPENRPYFSGAAERDKADGGVATAQCLGTAGPRVELLLRLTSREELREEGDSEPDNPGGSEAAEHSNTDKEARTIGERLRELKQQGFQVWDHDLKSSRPVEWRDMVILLRSPRHKAESFAKVFTRLGVPLTASRRGLYEATEVSDLLGLLILLDNPLQDIPTLAVLRSPLVGLTLNELAVIRLAQRKCDFWTALKRFHATGSNPDASRWSENPPPDRASASAASSAPADPLLARTAASAWAKADSFLERYERWRELARRGTISAALETVLDETHYEDWLLAQPQGEQRRANVEHFLALTRQFDQFRRQGLFRFLRFVEAQQATDFDPEPAAVESSNAVRLMSVHQSKGLEFPVVVLADLGKRFNLDDLKGNAVLDEQYGICLVVKPPGHRTSYPSLPHWLAERRQRRETLGEEIRLLYVAMTRACDQLILSGNVSRASAEKKWQTDLKTPPPVGQMVAATSCWDWLGPLLGRFTADPAWLTEPAGQGPLLSWRLYEQDQFGPATVGPAADQTSSAPIDPATLDALNARLAWQYPHLPATREFAKASVTALRRRAAEEPEEEAEPFFRANVQGPRFKVQPPTGSESERELSAADVGLAHHRFLEVVALDRAGSERELRAEAERLCRAGMLNYRETAALDLAALASFWQSQLGARIRARAEFVHRELPFTVRLGAADLAGMGLPVTSGLPDDEFVIVQGVADLMVLPPESIWLVDFKTDHLVLADLDQKTKLYEPQVKLYADALARIYRRPVTESWLHFLAVRKTVRVGQTISNLITR